MISLGSTCCLKLNNTLIEIRVCGFRKDTINDNPVLHFTFINPSIIMIVTFTTGMVRVASELFRKYVVLEVEVRWSPSLQVIIYNWRRRKRLVMEHLLEICKGFVYRIPPFLFATKFRILISSNSRRRTNSIDKPMTPYSIIASYVRNCFTAELSILTSW